MGLEVMGTQFLNDPTLDSLIESGAFVGVFPNGHRDDEGQGGFWNLGSEPTSADDLEFIDLIFEALSLHNLDLTNAYAIGYSNGAGMVNLIGKKSSHFKAIAPLFSQQITSLKNITPLLAPFLSYRSTEKKTNSFLLTAAKVLLEILCLQRTVLRIGPVMDNVKTITTLLRFMGKYRIRYIHLRKL